MDVFIHEHYGMMPKGIGNKRLKALNRVHLEMIEQSPSAQPIWSSVMSIRPAAHVRRLLLIIFTAVTVLTVACANSDAVSSDDESPEAQSPTSTSGASLTSGGGASDFEISTPRDGVFDLSRLEGQPVLLNFWFPSCAPCRAELPDLQAAYEAHGDDIQFLGVQLLGLDSAEEGQEFLDELGITYPSGADPTSQLVRNFKIVGFPTTIFIDSNHNIVKKHAGFLSAGSIETLINSTTASGG
jgi:thiol-disulfide isomerase/thioredoxin